MRARGTPSPVVSRNAFTAFLVAAPPVLGAVIWIGILIASAATGAHPIWGAPPQSLSEAAKQRDAGAIVRFIEQGDRLTPAEAAAASHDRDIIQLILDETADRDRAP